MAGEWRRSCGSAILPGSWRSRGARTSCANAIDEILAKGEAEAACAVLDNRLAPLNAEHFRTIYDEHGNEPAILERLLRHPDLPVDIRILQARPGFPPISCDW